MQWTKETTRWIISNTCYEVLTIGIALLFFVLIFRISLLGQTLLSRQRQQFKLMAVCLQGAHFSIGSGKFTDNLQGRLYQFFSVCCRESSSITDTEYLSVFGNLEGLNVKILFDLQEKRDHYTAEKCKWYNTCISHSCKIPDKSNIARGHVKQLLSLHSPRSKD